MEQKQVYTISINPRGSEHDLSRTPRCVVFSSRVKAMYFYEQAKNLIKANGRNFYITFEETRMDDMSYSEDLCDDLETLNHESKQYKS